MKILVNISGCEVNLVEVQFRKGNDVFRVEWAANLSTFASSVIRSRPCLYFSCVAKVVFSVLVLLQRLA